MIVENDNSDKDFWGIQKLINENGGIDNFRCFTMMSRNEIITPFGFSMHGDKYNLVECKIDETRYKVSEGHKITLVPADDKYRRLYGYRDYEQCDFKQSIRYGTILLKTKEDQHVEYIKCIEPLCGKAYLRHEYNTVI